MANREDFSVQKTLEWTAKKKKRMVNNLKAGVRANEKVVDIVYLVKQEARPM